jgi:membrane associated rhomboid family serine protease
MSSIVVIIVLTVFISWQGIRNVNVIDRLLFYPYRIKRNKEIYRFISHLFVHGGVAHLTFNMISLYSIGSFFEYQLKVFQGDINGMIHFIFLYILGGLSSTIYCYYKNQNNLSYRSLGASGAVSSIIFASIIWNPKMTLYLFLLPFTIPAYIFGPLYLIFEYFAFRRGATGIANDAHISGAIFGIIYVLIIDFEKGKQFLDLIL